MNASNSVGAILCAKCGKFHPYSMECEDKGEIARLRAELAKTQTELRMTIGDNSVMRAELADAKAIARYETDCVEAAKEHITKLDAELAAKDARIAELEAKTSEQERWQELHSEVWKESTEVLLEWRDKAARAERAEAERDALRKNFAKYLVPAYRAFPLETARTCDEELDQSGALLGYVRDAARAALAPSPAEKDQDNE